MELGSYVIEDYESWSPGHNLPNGEASAKKLWSSFNQFCTNSIRSWRLRYSNEQVTESALMNPVNNPNYTREYCDFLFIWVTGTVVSGGNIYLRSQSKVTGTVTANGIVTVQDNSVIVENGITSNAAVDIVTIPNNSLNHHWSSG
ncbi:MAG: hypothetical protein GX640_05250 [Fibrobacter sp.]|nr:hypothetical protein [Fibrobacter sp.]